MPAHSDGQRADRALSSFTVSASMATRSSHAWSVNRIGNIMGERLRRAISLFS
jgi:hypothetical protein